MSNSTGFTPTNDSIDSTNKVSSFDDTPSFLSSETTGIPSPLLLEKSLVPDLAQAFDSNLEWKTDPTWVPGPWDEVAFARNIEKKPLATPPPDSGLVKQFVCSLCNKSYKRKNDARIHVGEVHLSLYRFFCPYCPHKTSRGWSYDRHLRNVHKIYRRDEKKRGARAVNGVRSLSIVRKHEFKHI